jgi:hypothetical protein
MYIVGYLDDNTAYRPGVRTETLAHGTSGSTTKNGPFTIMPCLTEEGSSITGEGSNTLSAYCRLHRPQVAAPWRWRSGWESNAVSVEGKKICRASWELWGRQTSVQIASYLREEHPARDVTIARDHCNCGREATMRY